MIRKLIIAAAAVAMLPAAASAATYSIQDAYTNPRGVFTVGYGTEFDVRDYPYSSSSCFGKSGFSCSAYDEVSTTSADANRYMPAVGVNTNVDGQPINVVDQVFVPTNVLFLHPGTGPDNFDSIVRFTSPNGGTYRVTGSFTRLDGTSEGNGTINTIYADTSILARGAVGAFEANTDANTRSASFNRVFTLAAGQSIYFNVNNNGDYSYDSTGLAGSISSVPEPATWGMMILGLGAVGGALRRRKATARVAYA